MAQNKLWLGLFLSLGVIACGKNKTDSPSTAVEESLIDTKQPTNLSDEAMIVLDINQLSTAGIDDNSIFRIRLVPFSKSFSAEALAKDSNGLTEADDLATFNLGDQESKNVTVIALDRKVYIPVKHINALLAEHDLDQRSAIYGLSIELESDSPKTITPNPFNRPLGKTILYFPMVELNRSEATPVMLAQQKGLTILDQDGDQATPRLVFDMALRKEFSNGNMPKDSDYNSSLRLSFIQDRNMIVEISKPLVDDAQAKLAFLQQVPADIKNEIQIWAIVTESVLKASMELAKSNLNPTQLAANSTITATLFFDDIAQEFNSRVAPAKATAQDIANWKAFKKDWWVVGTEANKKRISNLARQGGTAVLNTYVYTMSTALGFTADVVIKSVDSSAAGLSSAKKWLVEGTKANASKVSSETSKLWTDTKNGVSATREKAKDAIINTAKQAGDNIADAGTRAKDKVVDKAREAKDAAIEKAKDAGYSASETLRDMLPSKPTEAPAANP